MSNYISNSSVGPTVSKSSRYYGLPYSKQPQSSGSTPQDQARPHKIQVLKPIINYKHNAHKVIGIDMSQEEYFFYKPILGGRRLSNKNLDQGSPSQPHSKKESANQTPHSKEAQQIQIKFLTKSAIFKIIRPAHNLQLKEDSKGQMTSRITYEKENSNSNFLHHQSPLSSKQNQPEQSYRQTYYPTNNSRVSLSKKDLQPNHLGENSVSDPSSLQMSKNQMLAFENNKQLNNNPLKDISNRVVNQVGPKSSTPSFEQTQIKGGRYSLPFEIAPKNLKINNYLDQPFKQITPSIKVPNDRQGTESPFHHENSQGTIATSRYDKSPTTVSGGVRVTNFEDQSKYGGNNTNKNASKNNYFEKKRLSDNTLKMNEDKYKIEEEVIREIFDKKEKQRKGHNISVTTNTSTTSTNTARKSNNYGQFGSNNNQTARKSHTNSKTSSLNQTPSHNVSQGLTPAQTTLNIQNMIQAQDRVLHLIMDSIRRKTKPNFSLNETSRIIRDFNKSVKDTTTDNTLEFLIRQHSRTHYIAFAFVRALEDELTGIARTNESLQAIVLNALDYVKKNLKCFSEIIENQNKSHKSSKKDLNSNPFGVIGPGSTRNGANKENYGGNSNTTNKNIGGSKSEKKMFIKQNIQIALAFLKKICRLSKTNQEKFKEFLTILNSIESGTQTTKVKEQIKRALQQIRNENKQFNNTQSTLNFSQTQKNFLNQSSKKHLRRESITIEIEDEVTSPFGFAELKEVENEESTEENLQTSLNHSSKLNMITIDAVEDLNQEPRKPLLEAPTANLIDQPGRLSLQPQPLQGLKMGPPTPRTNSDRLETQNTDQDKENSNNTSSTTGGPAYPQLSIVTKKHASRISNTHEPITVRGARPSHRIHFNEQDNLQYAIAPAHINARSNSLPSREPYLPSEISKSLEYTLVLDLDETLVHFDPKIRTYRPRPGALKFLNEMSKFYEIVVFTAGLKDYADWILNDFDRSGFITHRLYRDHTKYRNGVYVKDLSKLGRDLRKVVIIDNIEENFQAQPDNGIPIKGWYHDQHDRELEKYAPFLRRLVVNRIEDIRSDVKQFKTQLSAQSFVHQHGAHQPSQKTNKAWGEEESSEEESPTPKKKPQPKKQESSSEEEESEEENESSDDEPKKKPPPPKKKQKSESSEEEESESDKSDQKKKKDKKKYKKKEKKKKSKSKSKDKKKNETEKQIKELKKKLENLEDQLRDKDDELDTQKKDLKKVSQKMLDQDSEISNLRLTVASKEDDISFKEDKIREKEQQIVAKNAVISQQQAEIAELGRSNIIIDGLNKQLQAKQEEIGILKAKIYLDMIAMNIKVVAEYPDMVEENNELYETVDLKQAEIEKLHEVQTELESKIKFQEDEIAQRNKRIKELTKDKETQKQTIKELQSKQKQILEVQKVHESQISQLEHEIQAKNDELETRLENISKLIQKNEQLNQQLRVQKQRLEKFKNDQVGQFQRELADRASEIEVLKEMVKGNQLQLRAKEKELLRFKQKVQQLEGAQLAYRQQQNLTQQHSAILPPQTIGKGSQKQLGQLKNTPNRYNKFGQPIHNSKLQSVNTSNSYFPPLDAKSQDQFSQYSAKSIQNRGDSKERQRITTLHNYQQDKKKSSVSKRIVEEADHEIDNSNTIEQNRFQQSFSQKSNHRADVQKLGHDVRSAVYQENDEIEAEVEDPTQKVSQKSVHQNVMPQFDNSHSPINDIPDHQIAEVEGEEQNYQEYEDEDNLDNGL